MSAQAKSIEAPAAAHDNEAPTLRRAAVALRKWPRHRLLAASCAMLGLAAAWHWFHAAAVVRIDNAFVVGHVLRMTSPLDGVIDAVQIQPRQPVEAGTIALVVNRLERDLQVAQALARLQIAVRSELQRCMQQASTQLKLQLAERTREHAKARLERVSQLAQASVASDDELSTARHAFAEADLNQRLSSLELRRIQHESRPLPAERSGTAEAIVALRSALAERVRSTLRIPARGYVYDIVVQAGEAIERGAPLAIIVPEEPLVVQANVLESQRALVKLGQPARVHFDSYPKAADLNGHVTAIAPAAAAAFSPLPRFNIDSTWIKVSQRIPVFVSIDDALPLELRPPSGTSAEVALLPSDGSAVHAEALALGAPEPVSEMAAVTAELQASLDQVVAAELRATSDGAEEIACMALLRSGEWTVK
jgi:membrane fusion protein, multidrug efflux system